MKKSLIALIIAVVALTGLSLFQFRENRDLRRDLGIRYLMEGEYYEDLLTQTSRVDWENVDLDQDEGQQLLSSYRRQLRRHRYDYHEFQNGWINVDREIRRVSDMLDRLADQGELTQEEYDELETLSHGLGRLYNNVQFTSRFDWYNAMREENQEVSDFISDTLEDL